MSIADHQAAEVTPARDESVKRLPVLDLKRLHAEIARIEADTSDDESRRHALLELLLRLVNGAGAAYIERDDDDCYTIGPRVMSAAALAWPGDLDSSLNNAARTALDRDETMIIELPRPSGASIIAAPFLDVDGARPAVLALVAIVDPSSAAPFVAIAQLFAALTCRTREAVRVGWNATLAACADGQTLSETLAGLADGLAAELPGATVFIGVRRRTSAQFRLGATSSASGYDQRSDLSEALAALMQAAQSLPGIEYPAGGHEPGLRRQLDQIAARLQLKAISVVALHHDGARIAGLGIVACVADTALAVPLRRLHEVCRDWPAMLDLRENGYRSAPVRIARRLREPKPRFLLLAAMAGLLAIGAWPVNDRVTAKAELQPASRRIVSAPFAGRLAEVLVRPGDELEAGATVAVIDGRELELQRESLVAERGRMEQRANSARAIADLSAAHLAELEIEKLGAQLALIERRLAERVLRSPIAGQVLAGDLEKEQGRSLETGQALIEIAELSTMRIELRIAVTDIARIREDANVRVRFDAFGSDPVMAAIERIRPRTELGDRSNYYVAEAIVQNPDGLYRPGMNGRGVIEGEPTRLAWRFLRAPVEAIRRWQAW